MTATALRALPVPETEPAIEQQEAERSDWFGRDPQSLTAGVQGVLLLVVDNPPDADDEQDAADFGPQPTPSRDLPSATVWGRRLVQVVVEVMCGQRSPTQLLRWTSESVYDQLLAQTLPTPRPGATSPRRRPRVTSMRVCEPVDGVAELSAVVRGQHRVQALALRLEGRDGRWQVTALEAG